MKTKLLLPLILFLALTLTFIVQLQFQSKGGDPKALESALIGKTVPAFRLESLNNSAQQLDETVLKTGSPYLLNVWATWCPTCYAEHQYLTELHAEGVKIIGIDYKDERHKALAFLEKYGDPYQAVIYDPKGSLAFDLGVYGAPETFIIDGTGKIHHRHTGDVNQQVWLNTLKPIYDRLNAKNNP